MPSKSCSVCGTLPTLYIANNKLFCKAHKAAAEALLRIRWVQGRTRNPEALEEPGMYWANTHKRDRPIGIVHAK